MEEDIKITEEDIQYFKDYAEKIRKDHAIAKTKDYLTWVYAETLEHKQIDDDPDASYDYNDEYNYKRNLLCYLFDDINELAKVQNIHTNTDQENMFETGAYDIKLFDKYFHILNMVGQGSLTIIEVLDKIPKEFVTVIE